jgi:uncharacterized damage-inducible protein DinB
MLAHPHTMALFSAWANQHIHAACSTLPASELALDRKAFFASIVGTMNHILLVDLLYRERIEGQKTRFSSLDEILYDDVGALRQAQTDSDTYYATLLENMSAAQLQEPQGFHTLLDEPEYWQVPKWVYYSNLFQHQVHHRGQVHNMLSQAGIDPPPIGFIEYQLEHGDGITRRKV